MSGFFVTLLIFSIVCSSVHTGKALLICPPNSQPRICGKLCEPTCERPVEVICEPANPEACRRQCRCKPGYVREPMGRCVKPDQCPCKAQQ